MSPKLNRNVRRVAVIVCAMACIPSLLFPQTRTTTTSTSSTSSSSGDPEQKVITMEPFVLSTEHEEGYYAEQTLAGARYNKNINDLPASITIINKEYLTDMQAFDMMEPVKYAVSGVTLNQPDADDFNIRGFRSRGGLRNGMRSGFGGFASSTWDVERLEVIKGPVAMLTGINSSAIGGTVNYISRKPTDDRRTSISAGFADNNEYRLELQASGPLVTWGDTQLQYRFTGGLWNRNFDLPNTYQDENFYGGAIRAKFGKNSMLTVEYSRLDKDSYYYEADLMDPVAYAAGYVAPRAGVDNFVPQGPGAFARVNNEIIEVEFTHTFSRYLSMRGKYQRTLEFNDSDLALIGGYLPNDNTKVTRNQYESTLDVKSNQLQLDLLGTFNVGPAKNELSGGIDLDHSMSRQLWFDYYPLPTIDIYHPDYSQDRTIINDHAANGPFNYLSEQNRRISRVYSYWIQDNVSFWKDRVILVGGWRQLDNWTSTQTYYTGTFREVNDKPIHVYKHGVIFKPIRNVSLYATQGINYFPSTGQIANPGTPYEYVFPSSEGIQKEGGVKWVLWNGKLYGSAAYFDLARTNVRSSRLVTFPDGTVRSIEAHLDTTTKGFECDIGSRVRVPMGTIDFVGTYYDAESLTPNHVPAYNAPTYMTTGTVKYTFQESRLKGLSIGGAGRHESQAYMTAALVNHRPTVYTAFVNYRFNEHISGGLAVDNLTDKRYAITAGPTSGELAQPRKFRFNLTYTF